MGVESRDKKLPLRNVLKQWAGAAVGEQSVCGQCSWGGGRSLARATGRLTHRAARMHLSIYAQKNLQVDALAHTQMPLPPANSIKKAELSIFCSPTHDLP